MRVLLIALIAGGLMAATAATSMAKPEEGRPERGPRSEEFRAKMLEKFDADGDGTLSDEEKAAARKAFQARRGEGRPGPEGRRGPENRPSREEIIKKFDADGDGELNEEERQAARTAWQARMKERREAVMKKFDKDGDGELNEEERAALRKEMGQRRGSPEGRARGPEGRRPEGRGPRERGPEGRGPRGGAEKPL